MRFTALILSFLAFQTAARADDCKVEFHNVSEFIHEFEHSNLKSFIETPDGTHQETKKHSAIQFLQAELPLLADENRILPIVKPSVNDAGSFTTLRAQMAN